MALASATRVGPYEVLSVLGGGAMGEVYRARDTRLDRTIALKVISEECLNDTSRRRRFVQEARSASALNHPNIVVIHDFGTQDGISYIASELVEGQSLRDLIRQGALPMPQLLDIAVQMADGLAAAHQSGIVHRDLKPENIMITPDGRVKILDFGLAKPVIECDGDAGTFAGTGSTFDGRVTEPGLIVGTVGYMSPEQARGSPVGFQSDQFSFGLVLHEMASGQPAFRRETPMQTLLAIANAEHPPFTPGPVAFRLLVERCLRSDAEKRFADTREIAERLRKIRSELPVKKSAPAPRAVRRAAERLPMVVHALPRQWIFIAVASFAAVALLAYVLAHLFSWRPPDVRDLSFTPFSADGQDAAFPAIDPSGKVLAWSANVGGSLQIMTRALNSGAPSQLTHLSWDCVFPFWSADGQHVFFISGPRGAPALYLVPASGGLPELAIDNVARAAISPQGGTLALLRPEQGGSLLSLWYAAWPGGQPVQQDGIRVQPGAAMAWSPDGHRLGIWGTLAGGSSGLFTIPAKGGVPRLELRVGEEARPFTWLADNKRVLFSDPLSDPLPHLSIADLRTGTTWQLTSGAGHETLPSASGAGAIAFQSLDSTSELLRVALPGGPVQDAGVGSAPAWSPAGKQYAYVTGADGGQQIRLRDTRSEWEHTLLSATQLPGRTWDFRDVSLSPDGRRAAFTRIGPDGAHIFLTSLGGLPPVRLTSGMASDREPSWSPDGRWIVFRATKNGHDMLLGKQVGSSARPVKLYDGAVNDPVVSPDGNSIALIGNDGALSVLPWAGGAPRRLAEGDWLRLAWSGPHHLIAAKRTSDDRLMVDRIDIANGAAEPIADLGAWPAPSGMALAPVSGVSVAADGSTALVAVTRTHGSIWLLQGLK